METDSDDDDDKEEDDEVVADTEWGDLESEDTLTGIHSSLQGPFPFHAGGGESVRPEEAGRIIGPSSESAGAGGSAATPEVPTEGRGPPPCSKSQRGRADPPLRPRCRGRGAAPPPCPRVQGRRAPRPGSRGRAQNGPVPRRRSRDLGVHHPNVSNVQQRKCKSSTPLFSLFLA